MCGMGRDSSVGIATSYGLDQWGIESPWGRDFPHQSRLSPGAEPASCTMGTEALSGGLGVWGVVSNTHSYLAQRLMKE
jgi:hypothetical protein